MGCPSAALAAVEPVAGLLTHQAFLDGIEPDERRYHEGEPLVCLRAAAAAATAH